MISRRCRIKRHDPFLSNSLEFACEDKYISQNNRSLNQNLNMKSHELKSEIVTTSVNLFNVRPSYLCFVKYVVLCNLYM
jgi:hypothetical protein